MPMHERCHCHGCGHLITRDVAGEDPVLDRWTCPRCSYRNLGSHVTAPVRPGLSLVSCDACGDCV